MEGAFWEGAGWAVILTRPGNIVQKEEGQAMYNEEEKLDGKKKSGVFEVEGSGNRINLWSVLKLGSAIWNFCLKCED